MTAENLQKICNQAYSDSVKQIKKDLAQEWASPFDDRPLTLCLSLAELYVQ